MKRTEITIGRTYDSYMGLVTVLDRAQHPLWKCARPVRMNSTFAMRSQDIKALPPRTPPQLIAQLVAPLGVQARHVEAYVRLAYSTLDSLSAEELLEQVQIGVACVHDGGTDAAERLAVTFGL